MSPETIESVAELHARSTASSIIHCLGITQHRTAVDNVKSLATSPCSAGRSDGLRRASTP